MDSGCDKKRMNVEDDRLSNLPDDLIHKILSFISIDQAIETSGLSPRWRFLWKSMPYLNFSSEHFSTLRKFSKFVNHLLSRRNNLVEVYLVKLRFRGKVSQVFVKRILNYAISHNVQQLDVECLLENDIEFPLSIFSSQSLKHLSLTNNMCWKSWRRYSLTLVSTWDLPALTTLHLDQITLYDDSSDECIGLISKCVNLKNLTLKNCKLIGSNGFNICLSRLSELSLVSVNDNVKFVNVVAPHLKNLSIRGSLTKIMISAPNLAYLLLKDYYRFDLSTDGFRALEKVNICHKCPRDPVKIVDLLQLLHSVKFLTLNLEILELLSSSVELISHHPSPFANLKSLKIYPVRLYDWELPKDKVNVSTEVEKYLLDGSPSVTFTMISREEIIAQHLLTELRLLLKHEKYDFETNKPHMELEKEPTESQNADIHEPGKTQPETKMQLQNEENMAHIMSCWNNLIEQVEERKNKACDIIQKLKDIENLLTKMPASKRAAIQPCFSRLRAEADLIMKKITDSMKIQCDEYHSRLNVCFHELATALQPSS